ncbi:MAG: hypothetical protein JHC81_04890 [Brevundimonas sp.]|uniref:hypothetical protein n=1 Tax=Brevundimonas sp. TaxID=1871086 RepID=UPI001A18A11C|nr:hypothetical protein [Brevundimonas sp.]MBJ7446851.1 hypothetical protein [Brevundimonas sp.]
MAATGPLGLDFNAVISLAALGGPMTAMGGALFALALPEADALASMGLRRRSEE